MKTGTTPPEHVSALRHQIETIAIAASTIKGLREPDAAVIDAIVLETTELLSDRHAVENKDHIDLLVERIAATL